MRKLVYFLMFLFCVGGYSQIVPRTGVILDTLTTTQLNGLDAKFKVKGSFYYDRTKGNFVTWNQTLGDWEDVGAGGGAEINDLSAAVTWANIPDANVPQSAVTQHQGALSITESQISDLSHTVDTKNSQAETAANVSAEWPNLDTDSTDDFSGNYADLTGEPFDALVAGSFRHADEYLFFERLSVKNQTQDLSSATTSIALQSIQDGATGNYYGHLELSNADTSSNSRITALPTSFNVLGTNNDVSIGKSTVPSSKLDVLGTVTATAFVGDGAGLTGVPGDGTGTDDQTAAEVPITDTGAYYTGTDVEAALQEIGAGGIGGSAYEEIEESAFDLLPVGIARANKIVYTTTPPTNVQGTAIGFTPVDNVGSTNIEDALNEVREESDPTYLESFVLTSPKIAGSIWDRYTNGYSAGTGFPNDIANTALDVAAFTADPDQYRPVFGEFESIPAAGQNLHTSAVQAYALGNVTLANTVMTELLGIVNANDLSTAYWAASPPLRWDNTDDLWIQCAKVKKMKDSYYLLKRMTTVLSAADKATIETWFADFAGHAYGFVEYWTENYWGADWHLNGLTTFNPEGVYPGGGNIENPIQDASGNDLDFTVSWAQDLFNNRFLDVVAWVHSYAITSNDYEKEFYTREYFKQVFKYGVFPNGITWEMIRATDGDPTLGVFYTLISVGAMVQMAHLDAQANHFPDDRLYDYTTVEGITAGSTTITTAGYAGSSTTDGSTPKGLLMLLKATSNFLRTQANGGWNDLYYFEDSGGTENALDITGVRQPSTIPAMANLYYKDQDLVDWYTYNTTVGYPVKVTINEGYLAGVATGNEDMGPWGNMVIGALWLDLERAYFPDRDYVSAPTISTTDDLAEGLSNFYSQWATTATETIRFTDGSNYIQVETDGSPTLTISSASADFPAIFFGNSIETWRHELDTNGRYYLKDGTNNNNVLTVFPGAANNLLKLYNSNVGILDSGLPAYPLDVTGDINSSTAFRVAGVLQTKNSTGTTAGRPSSPDVGDSYFDTTLGIPVWWDGTNWVDSDGVTQ